MRKLRCLIGLHSWELVHIPDEGGFWRRCRICGKERVPRPIAPLGL
jgi:hypothetical protein